jgi:hypothetical protein
MADDDQIRYQHHQLHSYGELNDLDDQIGNHQLWNHQHHRYQMRNHHWLSMNVDVMMMMLMLLHQLNHHIELISLNLM